MSECPSCNTVCLHGVFQHRVELRRTRSGQGRKNFLALIGRNPGELRDAVVVNTIVGNARRETVLESGCARRQVSAEAYAVKGNLPRIDVFTRQYIVHHGCDDLFPVRPEMEPLPVNGSELTWTVEYQYIEAAFDCSTRAHPAHFLCGPVEAVSSHLTIVYYNIH
jgi:hypothetical protein